MGYDKAEHSSTITHLYLEGKSAEQLQEGDEGVIVLSATPFYAEGGGQAGELGDIQTETGVFEVQDTKKSGQAIIHHGVVKMGSIRQGQLSEARVASQVRAMSAKNHSATHLLHAALREHLGTGVTQKGSLVNSEVLRFDFSYDKALTEQDIITIENIVNQQILANQPATVEMLSMTQAQDKGAMALFGEKYGDTVRVLSMGTVDKDGKPFSIELCGGLHVQRTGDIGLFKIVSEQGIAAGIRRIEAVTGMGAVKYVQQGEKQLNQLASQLKAKRDEIADRVNQLTDKTRDLEKQLERLQQKLASSQAKDLINNVQDIKGQKF